MNNPTPDNHPNARASDDTSVSGRMKNWWGPGRGYRDLWLLAITGLVLAALMSAQNRVDDIQQNRVETVEKVCKGQNANAKGVNKAFDYISNLILAGTVLPGDEILKLDDRGTKTKSDDIPAKIRPGKLSRDFTRKYEFPTPAQRLAEAQKQVEGLEKLNVPVENCKQAVKAIQETTSKEEK